MVRIMQIGVHIPPMNSAPEGWSLENDAPSGFAAFYRKLHDDFTSRQATLAAKRRAILDASHNGAHPTYLPASDATMSAWRIDLPAWVADQRNQMTGPADDAELSVKLMNSGAPGVMLDLEDSMANTWSATMIGLDNCVAALYGDLAYDDAKRGRRVGIESSSTVAWIRPRGLHLSQAGVIRDSLTSASLFDLAMLVYRLDFARLRHPLAIYIPKSESAEEAFWWKDVFAALADAKGAKRDSIKCMALVEAHPMAFQMEEFAYNLRDNMVGLNLGRWDYMASLIDFVINDPNWVLPDRNTIPHDVPFFQNLRRLIPEVAHRHNLLAIGGMTALFPDRSNPELNERALRVLAEDKKNEATAGMDGAWTGHPDQNEIALAQFPVPNQIARWDPKADKHPDLRPSPMGLGTTTETGTRAGVRTVIRYRHGYLNGLGASLLDGYMEDLATDRIYRLMIAQRVRHGMHTAADVTRFFDEELAKLLDEKPADPDVFEEARIQAEAMITKGFVDPI
jgi:malate synthase